jgi:hypothetical protein
LGIGVLLGERGAHVEDVGRSLELFRQTPSQFV